MAWPLSGPSNGLLLWTRHSLLVIAAIVALVVLLRGDVFSRTGAVVLLWRVLDSFRTFNKP
jgi:hypothetical protein